MQSVSFFPFWIEFLTLQGRHKYFPLGNVKILHETTVFLDQCSPFCSCCSSSVLSPEGATVSGRTCLSPRVFQVTCVPSAVFTENVHVSCVFLWVHVSVYFKQTKLLLYYLLLLLKPLLF